MYSYQPAIFYQPNTVLLLLCTIGFLITACQNTTPHTNYYFWNNGQGRYQRGGRRKRHSITTVCGNRPLRPHYEPRPPPTFTLVNVNENRYHNNEQKERQIDLNSSKILYFNSRSVRNKALVINDLITETDSDMVFINETWLAPTGDEVVEHELTPPGYSLFSNPRTKRDGGGIAIVYKKRIVKIKREDINAFNSFECTIITALNTTFVCLYHPPPSNENNCTNRTFVEDFQNLVESLIDVSDRLIFLGDFNIHFDKENETYSRSMKTILANHGLTQHVMSPTHEKGHIIDWVITNSEIISNLAIKDMCISDHSVITFLLDTACTSKIKRHVTSRNLKAIDIQLLNTDIKDELCIRQSQDSVNADVFNDVLRKTLDQHAPLKTKAVRDRTSAPWMTESVILAKQRRRAAERKWRNSNSSQDREEFKIRRDQVIETIAAAKRDYYHSEIVNCTNSKTLFSIVNEMCGRSQIANLPSNIPSNELPDVFVDYFISKVSNIRQNLDSFCHNVTNQADAVGVRSSGPAFDTFREVTSEEIRDIIVSSPPKSCVLDPIPTKLLLSCLESTLDYITQIINHSLEFGFVPECYKKAIVSPLLKKPNLDPDNLKNYRPVSNLPFISKILEKVVLKQLKEYLISNNLIEIHQSAYREGHSTETALLKITNDILMSCDNGEMSVLTLLDLSAAFDTIDHSILCHTLSTTFGIGGNVLCWFKSYLSVRSQAVMVNGVCSAYQPLRYGVPQGSVLGPVLYTLYAMPLGQVIKSHSTNYHMYADDIQLYKAFSPNNNISSVCVDIEDCCTSIKSWMQNNKLKLNNEKTEIMLCGTQPKIRSTTLPSISVGDNDIHVANKAKNLGVILDSCLTMEDQINHMVRTMNFELRRISQLKLYLPLDSLKTVVVSLVLSRLDYCNSLLAGLPDIGIDKLQRVQNRAARIVLGLNRFDRISTKSLLRTLHWLPVRARIDYKIALTCFNAQNSRSPYYIQELIVPYTPVRQLRSTNSNLLHVPRTKLKQYGDRSFCKVGPSVWNSLPLSVRSAGSVTLFKKRLKTHLFVKYLD